MSKKRLYITSIISNILLDLGISVLTYKLFWSIFWIFSIPLPPIISLLFNMVLLKADKDKKVNPVAIKIRMTGYIILNSILVYGLVVIITLAMIKITGRSR